MYATCLHCNAPLGRNDIIEHFPVGRRLAFDAAKGRLWVVCLRCRRWNLTPLEERWEAIEECERLFGGSRLRTSTDNIGLARVGSGVDLIRIGAPLLPEMAAWRYGDELRRRWKRHGLPSLVLNVPTLSTVSTGAILFMAGASGSEWGTLAVGVGLAASLMSGRVRNRDLRARVVLPDGRVTTVRALAGASVSIRPDPVDGWSLRLVRSPDTFVATNTEAARTLRGVLAYRNASGGQNTDIAGAVARIHDSADARTLINRIARAAERTGLTNLDRYPTEALLTLEMALHDETERRALDGELEALGAEWELAEEIAKVADDMFLPSAVRAQFDGLSASVRAAAP